MEDLTHPRVDAYIRAAEARLAPLRTPDSPDPVRRRADATHFDSIMSTALHISAPATASADYTASTEDDTPVRLRVYWPGTKPATVGSDLPIVVMFYGGGFMIAGIDWIGWDALFRSRAQDANVIVVAADYSHAPETQYPTQPEQCLAAWEWAVAHAEEIGGNRSKMCLAGTSSGGNLAAATILMNADRARHHVELLFLEQPSLDLTMGHLDTAAVDATVSGQALREMGEQITRAYLGEDPETARLPYASPLLADDVSVFPRTVVHTSEMDPLRGDGEALVRRLTESGVPAVGICFIGMTHDGAGLRGAVPSADYAHRAAVAVLRTLHDSSTGYPDPTRLGAS